LGEHSCSAPADTIWYMGDSQAHGDSYHAVLQELTPLYADLPSLRLRSSHRRATHIAHGWMMRVIRGCEAVLLLRDRGYAVESWPIRRSVLEHVVALKWLAHEGSRVVDPIVRELGAQATHRREAAGSAGWRAAALPAFDDAIVDAATARTDLQLDTYLAFKHRCDKYGTEHDWASYLIETAHSHPGWETAAPYVDEGPPVRALLSPPEVDRDDEGWVTIELWEALFVLNLMLLEPPWDAILASTKARF
jgi:hypothetical protein